MRRPVLPSMLIVTLLAEACTIEPPLARPNPFDPDASAEFWIAGPDSVHGAGTKFVMRLEGTVPLPAPGTMLVGWHSSEPTMVVGGAGGEFMLLAAPSTHVPIVISAELSDKVTFAKTIYVGP